MKKPKEIIGWITVNKKGIPTTVNVGEDGSYDKQPSLERGCFDLHLSKRFAKGYCVKGMSVKKVRVTFTNP